MPSRTPTDLGDVANPSSGTDNNKGYECDEKQGVGKTNPARSGCTPPSS